MEWAVLGTKDGAIAVGVIHTAALTTHHTTTTAATETMAPTTAITGTTTESVGESRDYAFVHPFFDPLSCCIRVAKHFLIV